MPLLFVALFGNVDFLPASISVQDEAASEQQRHLAARGQTVYKAQALTQQLQKNQSIKEVKFGIE